MSQLFPEVIDASSLQPKLSSNIFLPAAVEGQADTTGTATAATIYTISRVDEASGLFGATSSLYQIVKALLDRGAGPVKAVASVKGATAPTLTQRQTAWEMLESDESVRLRLTDSEIQADLAGLAVSVKNASLINNKQIAFVGLPSGTSKAALISGATAIGADADGAKRTVLVGPGIYDSGGVLRGGSFATAATAAEVAKNADPSNDLDLWPIMLAASIELAASGIPVFRRRVAAGVAVNDFEDLLKGGVSPLMPGRVSGVQTSHLRMIYSTDSTFDALMTRIIIDQIFIDVRDWIYASNILRLGNTATTRGRIASGVEAVLIERGSWIEPVSQADGTVGYNVSVTPSSDMRSVTVGYEGRVVRGIQTILIAPTLTIPA